MILALTRRFLSPETRFWFIWKSLSIMIVKSYVFDYPLSTRHKGPSNQILKMTGKKYTTNFSENEGLTLLFAHCVGSRELR